MFSGRRLAHVVLVVLAAAFVDAPLLAAQLDPPRIAQTVHGDFVLIGSTLGHDCGGPAVVVGTVGACGSLTNDAAPDVYWISDSPGPGEATADLTVVPTDARTTSVLVLPNGAQVVKAFLYWAAGPVPTSADSTAMIARPGAFETEVTAVRTWRVSDTNQSVADVTALVEVHGAGAYRVGGIAGPALANREVPGAFAAWWMVVVYEREGDPERRILLEDGPSVAPGGSAVQGVLPLRIPTGDPPARLAFVTYGGRAGAGGESFTVNGHGVSDATGPDDLFNGSRSHLGVAVSGEGDLPRLSGGSRSHQGIDLDVLGLSPWVVAGLGTNPFVLATGTESLTIGASIVSSDVVRYDVDATIALRDLDGGARLAGDELEYTITIENLGEETATKVSVSETLSPNETFVPGSLELESEGVTVGLSDAAGDDHGEVGGSGEWIRVLLGVGADANDGGAMASGARAIVRYRTRVLDGAAGESLVHQAYVVGVEGDSALGLAVTDGEPSTSGAQPHTWWIDVCGSNEACAIPTPLCDLSSSPARCVGCLDDGDCSGLAPTCAAGSCVCVVAGEELCGDGIDQDCDGTDATCDEPDAGVDAGSESGSDGGPTDDAGLAGPLPTGGCGCAIGGAPAASGPGRFGTLVALSMLSIVSGRLRRRDER